MFHASRRLRFEDTNRNMSPAMRPKSFGTFSSRNGPQGVFPQVPWERGWHQTINYPTIREDNCVTFLLFLVFSFILATSGLSRSHG